MLTLNTTPAVCAESVVSITHALIWRPITVGFWNFTRTWTSNYVELQQVLEFGNIWLKSACSELAKKKFFLRPFCIQYYFLVYRNKHMFFEHTWNFFPNSRQQIPSNRNLSGRMCPIENRNHCGQISAEKSLETKALLSTFLKKKKKL
jgi:hypothetical protein